MSSKSTKCFLFSYRAVEDKWSRRRGEMITGTSKFGHVTVVSWLSVFVFYLVNENVFFTADIFILNCRRSVGVPKNINNASIVFERPWMMWQCDRVSTHNNRAFIHLLFIPELFYTVTCNKLLCWRNWQLKNCMSLDLLGAVGFFHNSLSNVEHTNSRGWKMEDFVTKVWKYGWG